MQNEFIFVLMAIFSVSIVYLAARMGRSWLLATIVMNLILVSTLGAKLIQVFGITTNVGNVFYAAVFLATHMLVEFYGEKEGWKSVFIGFLTIVTFVGMTQLTLRFISTSESVLASDAMDVLFRATPRIALASMIAYVVSQIVNISFYSFIHGMTGKSQLWLRDTLSNVVGQFVDSILFFSISFWGILPFDILIQSLIAGYLMKVCVGALGIPFFYLNRPAPTVASK